MWLPEPLYKSLLTVYFVVGAMILAGALYMGFSAKYAPLFIATGLISIAAGLVVFVIRRSASKNAENADPGDAA